MECISCSFRGYMGQCYTDVTRQYYVPNRNNHQLWRNLVQYSAMGDEQLKSGWRRDSREMQTQMPKATQKDDLCE